MPGTTDPIGGLQGFVAKLQNLIDRMANVETTQRQAVTFPPGVITRWIGANPPAGALSCNGATFSATTYPQLYAANGNSTTLPTITGFVVWTGLKAS